jgi:glyceraldehyde 3-phosphate dehydrogenase
MTGANESAGDPLRVGLMGFGRIGRNLFRQLQSRSGIEVTTVVDVAEPEGLAYLLRYDSIYGRFPGKVQLAGDTLTVGGKVTRFRQDREPGATPWGELDVEVVVQATGRYRTAEWCRKHLAAGARRVILASTPEQPGNLPVLLRGINDDILVPQLEILALGSNTANAAAPILAILDEAFGLERSFFTTVHAFTGAHRLADVPSTDFRTSRAAGENIIPTETNSPQILEEVMPQFAGKIQAVALNVPVPDGSTVDMVSILARPVTVDALNDAVRQAAEGRFAGIVEYNADPIVSSDVVGSTHSSVFDSLATMVIAGTMAKTITWFDNGWGYAARVVEVLETLCQPEFRRVRP